MFELHGVSRNGIGMFLSPYNAEYMYTIQMFCSIFGVLTQCPPQVSVMSAMGEECAIGTKTMGNK